MNSNIGYLYYKEYYKKEYIERRKIEKKEYEEGKSPLIEINQNIVNDSKINKLNNNELKISKEIKEKLYKEKLYFKTTYPGLIIGTGYSHILKEKEEFKLGLEFDYTTGLPIINGSSVKGLLRSVFYNKKDSEELMQEKEKYVKDILKELLPKDDRSKLNNLDFKELTYGIFEGKYKVDENGKEEYKSIPINKRDIFIGAMVDIEETSKLMGRNCEYLLGEDYITPHKKLKNPNPIKFLKIMPNVVWCFGFNLKDQYNKKETEKLLMSKDIKEKLFKQIILDFGIGAKTNVGYGQLEYIDDK